MRVSISTTNYSWPGGPDAFRRHLTDIGRFADDVGFDTVWVPDHLVQADPTASDHERDMLEAYTTLGFLAAATTRVHLGTMVSAATFRPPALLVKAVSTVHALSGGRAWLGIGAGYHDAEARAMGLEMPPVAERFDRLTETLQIADRLWSGDSSPFTGRYYRLEHPVGVPLPVHRPRMLVGGTGKRRTLRLVARYADACNVFDIPDGGATVRENLAVLARHCDDVGRPFEDIETTLGTRYTPGETATDVVRRCTASAELGIDHAVFLVAGPWAREHLDVLAAAARELAPVSATR